MREEIIGDCRLILGDCSQALDQIGSLDRFGAVVSDPPYPNSAGHFLEGIKTAEEFLPKLCVEVQHALLFWTEMEIFVCGVPHVATHIWHRTNSNRPDNYEPIFEYHADYFRAVIAGGGFMRECGSVML